MRHDSHPQDVRGEGVQEDEEPMQVEVVCGESEVGAAELQRAEALTVACAVEVLRHCQAS